MEPGDTIGKYRLVDRLGRGGMGEVWLATATGYGGFTKNVVLKTLLPELASDPLFIELLAREAKTCSKLSHPNLIEVFDFCKYGEIYLLAMEHVMGQPLNAIMRAAYARGAMLPAWFALRVAWECCGGVQYAHEQGVIHCDLSPSNLMITYTGTTKVLDFGVAHTAALGPKSDRLKGKYSYMAPERITTRATDVRTDIYALGVMLYLVFTGRLPFIGETDAALLHRITHEKLVAPSAHVEIDPRIEDVILRAMHPDPVRRFQNMTEMVDALAPCLEGQLGLYGQHHVAGYVASLFAGRRTARAARHLPLVAPEEHPRPETESAVEVIIDLETAPHAIPRATMPDVATAPARPPMRAPEPPVPPPLIPAFARAIAPVEPRSSVQSLFGERRTTTTTVAELFARGTRDDLDVPVVTSPGAVPAPLPDPPEPELRDPPRGAFGGYSLGRRPAEVVWPWPASRTKSG